MLVAISRDGSVTVSEHGEEDRVLDPADPLAILPCFRAAVELEEGVTAAQLMRALKPWSAVLSRAAWCDFDAWATAMDRPFIEEAEDADDRIACLEITPSVHYYGKGADRTVSTSWQLSGRYEKPLTGPDGHTFETCSVAFCDPRLIGGLPIRIVDRAPTIDFDRNKDVEREEIGVETDFFSTIVLGFLDDLSFHGSPEDTEEVGDGIRRSVAEILASLAAEPGTGNEPGS